MDNQPITVSFTPETRAFTLKIYANNAERVTKRLKKLQSNIDKMNKEKEALQKELEGINNLIRQVSGDAKAIGIPHTTMSQNNENLAQNDNNYWYNLLPPIDNTGYNPDFKWEQKIDYILKNAPCPLKLKQVVWYLINIDNSLKDSSQDYVFKSVTPCLSRMAAAKKVFKGKDGRQGSLYLHPSWFADGKIKLEFKDKVANIELI